MEDIKLTDFMRSSGIKRHEIYKICKNLGIKIKKKNKTMHLTAKDCQVILNDKEMPEEFKVKKRKARGLQSCRNNRFVYAVIDGYDGKHPVLVPKRLRDRMQGKEFEVEEIKDEKGVSFRHAWFSEKSGYERA